LARMSATRFVRGVFGTSRPPHGILQACAVRALPAASLLLAFSALAQPEYLPVPPAAKPLSAGAPSQGASSPQGLLTINSSSLQRAYNVDLESGKLEIVEYLKLGDDSTALWSAHPGVNAYAADMRDMML